MQDLVAHYDLKVDKKGFMSCPFHEDHTPSLKVYPEMGKGFYCFSCCRGGSVINFAMQYFGLDYKQTLGKLDNDFRLGIMEEKPEERSNFTRNNRRNCLAKTRKKEIVQSEAKSYNDLVDEHRDCHQRLMDVEPFSDEHQELCNRICNISILMEQEEIQAECRMRVDIWV